MKVALVHDYLTQDGGAERVLQVLQGLFPDAPTFTLVYNRERAHPSFGKKDIRPSFINKLPGGIKHYQWYLPLMPQAVESFDLSGYDLVISSASAFAKGAITQPTTLHICYCHTPTRYLWTDTHSYLKELRYPRLIKAFIPRLLTKLRIWDRLAADRVDFFVANSQTVADRIFKYYRQKSTVIYPPVDLSLFKCKSKQGGEYFLTGGRLVSYKRFDLTIQAFNRLGMPLKIFGTGPQLESLKKMAKKNIEFVGYVSGPELAKLYQNARAFIHPHVEDFGITAIEAMACGTPVIAYAQGGALETIKDKQTGLFFHEQRWEELADVMIYFKDSDFDPQKIHQHAQSFEINVFCQRFKKFVEERYNEFKQKKLES